MEHRGFFIWRGGSSYEEGVLHMKRGFFIWRTPWCRSGWYRVAKTHRIFKLQIIFHKRATNYRSLLRKMTYKDKGSYESSLPCRRCSCSGCYEALAPPNPVVAPIKPYNEPWHTYELILIGTHTNWFLSAHIWIDSCHTYEWVMAHIWIESCHTCTGGGGGDKHE